MNFSHNYNSFYSRSTSSIIKVFGVGGGGSNAVNFMYKHGIHGVDFIICNTDKQALEKSNVPFKLQLGSEITYGLGAGSSPEKGRDAANQSKDKIQKILIDNTSLLFITAGMGGGTGTGAAPIIAKIAKDLNILTIGIVTLPFTFEGKKKLKNATDGINALKSNCDTVIIILNDKIKDIYGNLSYTNAFTKADSILAATVKNIAEIITIPGYINVDFEDVSTVLKSSGVAVIGTARATGQNRSIIVANKALTSPLLDEGNLKGAKKILLSIRSSEQAELQMDELSNITSFIQNQAGPETEIIFGHAIDNSLQDYIMITIIATGFSPNSDPPNTTKHFRNSTSSEKGIANNVIINNNFPYSFSVNKLNDKIENNSISSIKSIVHNILPRHEKLIKASKHRKNNAKKYTSFCQGNLKKNLNWKSYDEPAFIRNKIKLLGYVPMTKFSKVLTLNMLGA